MADEPDKQIHRLRQLLSGIFGGSAPEPIHESPPVETPRSDGPNIGKMTVNGMVVIGHQNQVGQPVETALITQAQSGLLKVLVRQIGQAERANNPNYHDARTWTKVNALLGVDHHHDIPRRDFDRAKAYLEGWLRRLGDN